MNPRAGHTPWQSGPREAMETIMRMAGRTTFVTPSGGTRGAPTYTTLDIAHALAAARDPLGAALAMARACPDVADLASIQRLAVDRIWHLLDGTWRYGALVSGTKRYRLNLVLTHALHELILGRRHSLSAAARMVRMRKSDYLALYHYVTSDMEQLACAAAKDACDFLFRK